MTQITMQEIKARKQNLAPNSYRESHSPDPNIISSNLDRLIEGNYSRLISESLIRDLPKHDNSDFGFRQLLEVFDIICNKDHNASFILKSSNAVAEAVAKSRTGQQTRDYLKMKVARFKTKLSTKVGTNVDNIKDAAGKAVAAMQNNLKNNTSSIKSNVDKGLGKKEEAVKESYMRIYDAYERAVECDRILENQAKLEKYYNLKDTIYSFEDNKKQAIIEMCAMVDSFNINQRIKYNTSLENIMYTFSECNIPIDPALVLETVTDYYLVYTNPLTSSCKQQMMKIIENSLVFPDECKFSLSNTFKDIAKLDIKFDNTFELLTEGDDLPSYLECMDILHNIMESTKKEDKVKALFDRFKLEANKTPDKLRSLVYKFYVQSPDQILDNLPNFLSWIRMFFIVGGATAINPLLGIVALLADQAVKMTLSRKQLSRYITDYQKEIDKTDKNLKSVKKAETKSRLEAYKKQLEKSLEKLKEREDALYTDDENTARHSSDYDDEIENDDLFNFDEAVVYTAYAVKCIETAMDEYNCDDLTNLIVENFTKYDPEGIKWITEYLVTYPETSNTLIIANEFANYIKTHDKYNDSLYDLKQSLKEAADRLFNLSEVALYRDAYGFSTAFRLENAIEGYDSIVEYTNKLNVVQEMDIANTMKMAKEGLKKSIQGLSDKEKAMSRTVDVSCDQVKSSAEKALMNGNREAVIKGSLLPSASKIIKTAIISAAGWAVNPAITVIGLIGWIGVSKKLQAKERQLILDDIEIELNMCERYLKIAEDNNDMKAQRQLLITKRALERQRQRIKYKMIVYHNQKVDSNPRNDDDD